MKEIIAVISFTFLCGFLCSAVILVTDKMDYARLQKDIAKAEEVCQVNLGLKKVSVLGAFTCGNGVQGKVGQ